MRRASSIEADLNHVCARAVQGGDDPTILGRPHGSSVRARATGANDRATRTYGVAVSTGENRREDGSEPALDRLPR